MGGWVGAMNSIVDTNVVVRFLIGDDNDKFKGVYQFFKTIGEGKITVELPLICTQKLL